MNYNHVTLCFSLPRSRSQWLAWLYGQATTSWHDPLKMCKSPQDLKAMIDSASAHPLFIADTAAILFHSAITSMLPGATFLYVLRPLPDVWASIDKQGIQRSLALDALLSRAYERLLAESRAAPPENRCHYAEVDDAAKRWWPVATKRPSDGLLGNFFSEANNTVIDMPLRDQLQYPENTSRLLTHAE